jgi:MFS transporter, ACS family, hexuronate transporter
MAGAVGGMFISLVVGQVLQTTGSYVPIFLMAGLAYLTALGMIQLLVPTIKQVTLGD